jgi:hypothetical protein
MPLEFVTDSFLPSEEAQGVTGLKKTLLLKLKTDWQQSGQDRRSETGDILACLFYGRAVLFNSLAIV